VAIRQAIANGKLPPGSRLLEMKIALAMGISRGPLREALFQLEREGLVVRKPNRGRFVVGLTEDLARQIASLRGVLEGFAASLAVKRMTEEDFRRIEAIIGEMSSMARVGDFPGMVECDYRFHACIMQASGHPLLFEMWAGLDRKIRIYLSALNRMYGDMDSVVKGHVAILQALRKRDPKRASRIMSDHMVEVLEPFVTTILRSLKTAGPNDSTAANDVPSSTYATTRRGKPNSESRYE